MMSLSERIRPNIEAAPWVVDEVKKLEQQLTAEREAREKAEEERDGLKSMIASTPNGCKVIDAAMARIDVLQGDNQTVSLAAYEATSYAMYAMEKERDQWKDIAENAANEFMLEQKLHGLTAENLKVAEQRAESAEQKLREAQEQEPMFWVRLRSDGGYEAPIHNSNIEKVRKESGAWTPLYAAPIPPADVAELQRELNIAKAHEAAERATNETLAKQIAELTRKLAEQQENFDQRLCHEFYRGIETARKNIQQVEIGENSTSCPDEWIGDKPFARIQFFADNGDMSVGIFPSYGWELAPDQSGTVLEELTKLLEEAKRQAVPEELYNSAYRNHVARISPGLDIEADKVASKAMLSASPKPNGV